jgi:uncharacterized protein YndB with AHSA1/START domain
MSSPGFIDVGRDGYRRGKMRRVQPPGAPLEARASRLTSVPSSEVRPPERLVYTWRWEGAFAGMPETLVTLELRGTESETLLMLRHDNFTDPGLRQQHRSGWIAACDRLDRATTPPAPQFARPAAE